MANSAKNTARKPKAAPLRKTSRRQAIERAAADVISRYGDALRSLSKR